jgi:hypothetical protein
MNVLLAKVILLLVEEGKFQEAERLTREIPNQKAQDALFQKIQDARSGKS